MAIVYINGEFVAEADAKISILDRGFLFADGVYEVIPVFSGRMLCVDQHLLRLQESLEAIHMAMPMSVNEFKAIFSDLLRRNEIMQSDVNIYVQITRGVSGMRNHAIPDTLTPTVVAFCTPAKGINREMAAHGFSAITLEDTRRRDCFIKSTSLLPNILLYDQAHRAGALDAILTRNGQVTEGTSSNVFIVKDNQIITPPASREILIGVTRQLILALAEQNKIPYQEAPVAISQLQAADEIWLTGSSKEICPITLLDNHPVGSGTVGPMWHRMMDYYEAEKNYLEQQVNES